jgi:hypothetical protein
MPERDPILDPMLAFPPQDDPCSFLVSPCLVGLVAFAFFQNFECRVLLDLNGELGGRIGAS